jgi:pyruvate,orthophosphate dikinase
MYADVVLGLKAERETGADPFDEVLDRVKRERGVRADTDLSAADLRAIVAEFKAIVKEKAREAPSPNRRGSSSGARSAPSSVRGTTTARSAYRRMNRIPDEWGTACERRRDGVRQSRGHVGDRRRVHAGIRRRARSASTARS